jgi:hypothetical protein
MRLPQMEAGVGNVRSFAIAVHRPAVSMKKVFLASKLTPPTVSRYSVDRTEICNQVFLSFGAKVILIRGPVR